MFLINVVKQLKNWINSADKKQCQHQHPLLFVYILNQNKSPR